MLEVSAHAFLGLLARDEARVVRVVVPGRTAPLPTRVVTFVLFEIKDFLQGATGGVQAPRTLVELKQELEEIREVSLLVRHLLPVLSFKSLRRLVLDDLCDVG